MAARARKSLDQQLIGRGNDRALALHVDPFTHLLGQLRLQSWIVDHAAHARGQKRRERKLAAIVGGNFRGLLAARADDERVVFTQADKSQDLTGEQEGVARRQALDEIFLDLPKPPARNSAALKQAYVQHFAFDDCADIHAMGLGGSRVAGAPEFGFLILHDAAIAVIDA